MQLPRLWDAANLAPFTDCHLGNLGTGWWFNGQMDEVKVYRRALSAEEVLEHYNGVEFPPYGGPPAWPAVSTFLYDGDGNRVAKSEGGQTILYVNDYYEKNLTTGEVTTHYYLGGREIAYSDNGGLKYVHTDHLGSTTLVTDSDGNLVASSKYLPYGGSRSTSGYLDTDKLFTGQRLDQSGLYFYNARYYDPQIGRFISADTVVPDPSDPQNLNRYSYVLNNPLKYTDPSGHFWDWFVDVVSVVADLVELVRHPSAENAIAFVADVGLGILPFVPAVAGMTTRGANLGKTALSHGDDLVRLGNKADDAVALVRKADDVVDAGKAGARGAESRLTRATLHGNDLRTTRPARGYALVHRETGEILKYGDTIHGAKRYSPGYLEKQKAKMVFQAAGTKKQMHYWQHKQILEYKATHGDKRPPLNLTDW